MNKTLRMALGVVLVGGLFGAAIAQDQFPDVPENHWAYEALATMKKNGLLVGYPDGLFRGGRPATRYELAVAIHATYQYLKNITDGLDSQIKDLQGKVGGTVDTSGLQQQIDALKADIANMKGWGDDIANLKRMASTFEKELASLGVDVEAMKKDLKDLNDRVTRLEKNALPITIHGNFNLFMTAEASGKRGGVNVPGFTVDGRTVGQVGAGSLVGMDQSLSVFHEAAFKIAGTNEEGPKWHATLLIGNLLGQGAPGTGGGGYSYGFTAGGGPSSGFHDSGQTTIVFGEAVAEFDTSLLGQGFNAKVGRIGYKISPYIFQRPDTSPYYDNEWWDNGNHTFDGGLFGFNFGAAKFSVFAGRTNSGLNSTTGAPAGGASLSNVMLGAGGITAPLVGYTGPSMAGDNTLGLHLNVPIGEAGNINLAYLFHTRRTDTATPGWFGASGFVNRVQVFGGELDYGFGENIKLNAGYAQSNAFRGNTSVIKRDNYAWHVKAGYETDRWGLNAGYREIMPDFLAAGDWGRIGTWWNPTDIRGFHVGGHFDLTDALTLSANGEWYEGTNKGTVRLPFAAPATSAPGLLTGDKLNRYVIDLGYNFNESWNAMLGLEHVEGRGPTLTQVNGRPFQRWYNIGLGWKMSDMASWKFMWQISDADTKTGLAGSRLSGNLLTTQFSIKF